MLTTQGIPRWVVAGTRAITATEVDDLGFTPRPPAQCQYELEREAHVARHKAYLEALLANDALVMVRKVEAARKVEAKAARKVEAEVARKRVAAVDARFVAKRRRSDRRVAVEATPDKPAFHFVRWPALRVRIATTLALEHYISL